MDQLTHALLGGGTTTPAAISQGLTAILTGALVALCVKSFINARRRRTRG